MSDHTITTLPGLPVGSGPVPEPPLETVCESVVLFRLVFVFVFLLLFGGL